jgi:hypothetical protein
MRKGKLYILASILIITETLFIVRTVATGDEHITELFGKSVLSLALIYFIYKGLPWARLLSIIYYSILGLGCILAGAENEDGMFYLLATLYSLIIYQLIRLTPSNHIPAPAFKEQEFNTQHLSHEENSIPKLNLFSYPTLLKRYQAMFIDSMLILAIMIVVMVITPEKNKHFITIPTFIVIILLYEPLLTTYSTTLGQRIMGIHVRDINDPTQRIKLSQAYIRIFVKMLLGWISFLTIHSNPEHRAIHDFAGSSVMLSKK